MESQGPPRPRRVSDIISDSSSTTTPSQSPPSLPPRSPLRTMSKNTISSPRPTGAIFATDTLLSEPSKDSGISILSRQSFMSMNLLLETLDRERKEIEALTGRRRRSGTTSRSEPEPPPPPVPPLSPSSIADTMSTAQTSLFDEDGRSSIAPTSPATSAVFAAPTQPKASKRTHALLELLSSERAYASDLALTRDIHIPMAAGKPVIVPTLPTPPTSSNSSARTLSTASDSSASNLGAPMSPEDIKVIFSNISELAVFSDTFCEQIEGALGSIIDGGQGDDRIGALFLEVIPLMEPKYKTYITRHPNALEHLSKLPQTPALHAYFERTQMVTASLTHAWDLPSFLIKPVQRLLKYPLLLATIISETPNIHPDRKNLILAKDKLEEVARSVNEVRRRYEVVREVLMANERKKADDNDARSKSKWQKGKKGMSVPVGVAASVQLGRMKSLRSFRPKEANEEAALVDSCERRLKAVHTHMEEFARGAVEWSVAMRVSIEKLRAWALGFGRVIGLSIDQESEAFDAFIAVIDEHLLPMCDDLQGAIKRTLLPALAQLVESGKSPIRLLEALHALEPLHYGLLNLNFSKNRPPPALLEASQSYVALRGQLGHELPQYVALLERGTLSALREFVIWQAQFWRDVRNKWVGLWDVLCQEGERIDGDEETVKVWRSRWIEVWDDVNQLNITTKPPREDPVNKRVMVDPPMTKRRRDAVPGIAAALSALDPAHVTPHAYPESMRSPSRTGTYQSSLQDVSTSSTSSTRRGVSRKASAESIRSTKSGKSAEDPRPPSSRAKSMPLVPRRTSAGSGGTKQPLPPSPTMDAYSSGALGPSSHSWSYEPEVTDRGRPTSAPTRKPSFKRKMSGTLEVLRPTAARSGRSSSRKQSDYQPSSPLSQSMSFPPAVSGPFPLGSMEMSPPPPPPVPGMQAGLGSIFRGRARSGSNPNPGPRRERPLYTCQVVHPCEPPDGIEYRNLPFFQLHQGDILDVLREEGHPSLHPKLPLYVDDGEDCLLLVRDRSGDFGWALASFLIPFDYR